MKLHAKRSATQIDWKAERERIDLAAAVTKLIGPASKRRGESGRKLWWSCPLGTHPDANPSFCIDPGKPWWKCWGCGESGDAANLVMRLESMTFPESVNYLTGGLAPAGPRGPRKAHPPPAPRPPAKPSGMPEDVALALVEDSAASLWTVEGEDALAYLTGPRRLSHESIRAARLGWTPRADGVAWQPPGVIIPWYFGDRLAMVKVRPEDSWRDGYRERFPDRRQPPKYLEAFRDPARVVCYPDPASIRAGRPLVVTEGEFDALTLGEALGELAAVVTLGSASAEITPAVMSRFLAAPTWYVAMDNDPAGEVAAAKWADLPRARRVRPPSPYKDWGDCTADGVNLARWWRDILSGHPTPELFTHEEAASWRWGPALDDDLPGIIIPVNRP